MRLALAIVFLLPRLAFCQQSEEPRAIAPELVGKWCYMNANASSLESISSSCMTLKSDGTYDLQTDRSTISGGTIPGIPETDTGTWWVTGNQLYYQSNSAGKGWVRFQKANHPRIENTPVLIVNGAVFCSPSPRDPW